MHLTCPTFTDALAAVTPTFMQGLPFEVRSVDTVAQRAEYLDGHFPTLAETARNHPGNYALYEVFTEAVHGVILVLWPLDLNEVPQQFFASPCAHPCMGDWHAPDMGPPPTAAELAAKAGG